MLCFVVLVMDATEEVGEMRVAHSTLPMMTVYYVLPDTTLAAFETSAWQNALNNVTLVTRGPAAHVSYDDEVSFCAEKMFDFGDTDYFVVFLDWHRLSGNIRQQFRRCTPSSRVCTCPVLRGRSSRGLHASYL